MGSATKKGCIAFGVIFALAIIIVTLSISFKTISSTDVGLKFDRIDYKLGSEPSSAGLYVGTPGFTFVTFPAVFRDIQRTISCLDKDGLYLRVRFSYQYRPRLSSIYDIAFKYRNNDKFTKALEISGDASLLQTCGQFKTESVIQDRTLFAETFKKHLETIAGDQLMADILGVQVENIDRPSKYDEILDSTDAARENIQVKISERETAETRARTDLEKAKREAVRILAKAEVDARKIITKAYAHAEAKQEQFEQEADVYKLLIDSGFNFASYMGFEAMKTSSKPLQVGLKPPGEL